MRLRACPPLWRAHLCGRHSDLHSAVQLKGPTRLAHLLPARPTPTGPLRRREWEDAARRSLSSRQTHTLASLADLLSAASEVDAEQSTLAQALRWTSGGSACVRVNGQEAGSMAASSGPQQGWGTVIGWLTKLSVVLARRGACASPRAVSRLSRLPGSCRCPGVLQAAY